MFNFNALKNNKIFVGGGRKRGTSIFEQCKLFQQVFCRGDTSILGNFFSSSSQGITEETEIENVTIFSSII